MRAALAHALMLVFAAFLVKTGWFMVHKPERALRFFTFGTEPAFGRNFGIAWCKTVGWFFTVAFSLAIVLYIVLLPIDIMHSR